MHKIYEGSITWKVNEDYGNPHQVEIPNSLYVPKVFEWITSPQHWAHNATYANAYATNLDGTRCVTHHDCATLIWDDGELICAVPLESQNVFNLYTAPEYTAFTAYRADKPDCITENLDVFSHPTFTHSETPPPMHPYPLSKGET